MTRQTAVSLAGTEANLSFSPLAALPTEIVSTIASYLTHQTPSDHAAYDICRLRASCRALQEKTLPAFSKRFFHTLDFNTASGEHGGGLDMLLYFLTFEDVASAVKTLRIHCNLMETADHTYEQGLFSRVLSKLPKGLTLDIEILWSGDTSYNHYTSSNLKYVTACVRELTLSHLRIAAIRLHSIALDVTSLQELILAQKDNIASLEFESTIVIGGTWDRILRACQTCPALSSLYTGDLNCFERAIPNNVRERLDKNIHVFCLGERVAKAVRNPATRKIETYSIHRYRAWGMGGEAIELLLKAIVK